MAREETVEAIADRCDLAIEKHHSMAEFTSIGVGGEVKSVFRPDSIDSLGRLLKDLRKAGYRPRVIGGGANLVAGPGPFLDPIILTRGIRHGPLFEQERVRAGCGVALKRLVRACVAQGLGGLEFAEGIPGTVGGTVFMNAGSYGGQMSDVVREVSVLDESGTCRRRIVAAQDFAYRQSPFTRDDVIVEAVFELQRADARRLEEQVKKNAQRRIQSQPPGERSAGCIFKNPPGDSAGRLVDALGLKGISVGGASVSKAHGNFIVNRGDATPSDVLALIDLVKSKVREGSGVVLEEEVDIWR